MIYYPFDYIFFNDHENVQVGSGSGRVINYVASRIRKKFLRIQNTGFSHGNVIVLCSNYQGYKPRMTGFFYTVNGRFYA
jgi:hypothetical protein